MAIRRCLVLSRRLDRAGTFREFAWTARSILRTYTNACATCGGGYTRGRLPKPWSLACRGNHARLALWVAPPPARPHAKQTFNLSLRGSFSFWGPLPSFPQRLPPEGAAPHPTPDAISVEYSLRPCCVGATTGRQAAYARGRKTKNASLCFGQSQLLLTARSGVRFTRTTGDLRNRRTMRWPPELAAEPSVDRANVWFRKLNTRRVRARTSCPLPIRKRRPFSCGLRRSDRRAQTGSDRLGAIGLLHIG